jgi:asparagine synthase (glutamine-hydrolysing)
MCGIAGFIDFNKNSSLEILKKCTDTMLHRGPDGSGYEFFQTEKAQIGLGHRRLSIIDLTEGGTQPMKYRQYWIIFNGEIYNFAEIKEVLVSKNHVFNSHSDTEVILHAFEEWGIAAIHQFIGMFTFVLYDEKNQKVHCVRDRAGVKPFYYYWKDGLFLFASELKAFHQYPNFNKALDFNALSLYFQYGYVPVTHCIFKDTYKLAQGHHLEVNLASNRLTTHQYWDVNASYRQPILKISEQDAQDETEKILRKAFNYRMVADVPVGIFLSGGYDSSIVTALLQTERTDKLKTFSIGFRENGFDEAPFAKQVAEHLGTNHTEYYCTPTEAQAILPQLPFLFDEPFGDSSAIPTILVSQLARKEVTVSLSADAGDEVFAGYYRYPALLNIEKNINRLPNFVRSPLAKIMSLGNPTKLPFVAQSDALQLRYEKLKNVLAESSSVELLKSMSTDLAFSKIQQLMRVKVTEQKTYFDEDISDIQPMLNQLLAKDYKTYLVDDILTKVDRATMSVSLEGRDPFLDHNIIDWVAQLPIDMKIKNGVKKHILREITHKYIPKAIMDRPKMGFGIPLKTWFKEDLSNYFSNYLSKEKLEKQGILNSALVSTWLKGYENGKTENINILWYLLMFQMWYEQWME